MAQVDVVLDDAGMVRVRNPGGQESRIKQGDLRAALEQGFAPMTPEEVQRADIEAERGSIGQQALTAGETALSTATLGLSDYVGAGISPEWQQATRERRQVNPNAALAGEIAGVVAPALATGGTSVAARGVSAVSAPMRALGAAGGAVESGVSAATRALGLGGQSLLSRGVQRGLSMAASGALEGGAFEITRGMVDAVLSDTEYTAEKLTADLKKGVKWGAIGGGVVGVGSTLVTAAGKRAVDAMLQGRTLKQGLQDFAEKRAAGSVGSLKDLAGRENRVGRKLLDAGVPLERSAAAERAIRQQVDDASARLMSAAKRLDDAGVRIPALDIAKRMDDRVRTLQAGLKGKDATELARITKALGKIRETPTWAGATRVRNRIDKLLRTTDDDTLRTLRDTIDNSLTEALGLSDDALHAAAASGDDVARAIMARQGQAKEAAGKALEDLGDWGALRRVKREVDKRGGLVDNAGSLLTGLAVLKTLAAGGIAGLPGMAMAAGAGAAQRFARDYVLERGSGWLARMADAVHKADVRADRAIRGMHGKRVNDAVSKGSSAAVGEPEWTGALVEQAVGSAGSGPAPTPPPRILRPAAQIGNYVERYEQLKEQVQAFRDPKEAASILEAATGELAAAHPEVAQAVMAQVMADATYIESRMPAGVKLSMNPLAPAAPISRYDKLTALDIADALNDPPAVLEDLAAGRLNVEQWRALEARRPKMYNDWRSRVAQETLANVDNIPMQRRIAIGTAFQFPADWSMLPDNLTAAQAMAPAEPQAQGGGSGPDLDTANAEQFSTPSQLAVGG